MELGASPAPVVNIDDPVESPEDPSARDMLPASEHPGEEGAADTEVKEMEKDLAEKPTIAPPTDAAPSSSSSQSETSLPNEEQWNALGPPPAAGTAADAAATDVADDSVAAATASAGAGASTAAATVNAGIDAAPGSVASPCSPPKPEESIPLKDGGALMAGNGITQMEHTQTPHAVQEVEVVEVGAGEGGPGKMEVVEVEEDVLEVGPGGANEEEAQVLLVGDGEGGAGAKAAAAGGDVAAGSGGTAADSGKAKVEKKGKGKAFIRVTKEREKAGPCLCLQDSDGTHKTVEDGAHKTVEVARRCWPGINKPGGTARITKKFVGEEEVYGETVEYTYFDVRYCLGGSEKGVKATFLSCTPLEMGARQAAPREIFTVEVVEPTRRLSRPTPKPSPTRTSPLGPNIGNRLSSSSAKAKTNARGAVKNVSKTKHAKSTTEGERGKDQSSKKRARSAEGREGGGGGGKRTASSKTTSISKENQGMRQQREVPAYREEPMPHAITDLSVVAVAEKAPDAPLSKGRMETFQAALGGLFYQDTIQLASVKAGINATQGIETYDDGELTAALNYLQQVGKVMVDEGTVYRI